MYGKVNYGLMAFNFILFKKKNVTFNRTLFYQMIILKIEKFWEMCYFLVLILYILNQNCMINHTKQVIHVRGLTARKYERFGCRHYVIEFFFIIFIAYKR